MTDAGRDNGFDQATLDRFERHRSAWRQNQALRSLYGRWYREVRARLPDRSRGRWIELGSGPGFAREVIPELELSDVVQAPWHDHQIDAEHLPFADGELGALVLFDVLHHLPRPAKFLTEASRALAPGGRLVLCEPYVSALSFPIYRFLHEERCDLGVDPLAEAHASGPGAGPGQGPGKDPFDGNQAIPSLLLHPLQIPAGAAVPGLASDRAQTSGRTQLPGIRGLFAPATAAPAAVARAAGG